jgi:hypothetical protein
VKATDLAGMLRPVEKVSVANSTFNRPSCIDTRTCAFNDSLIQDKSGGHDDM